MSIRSILTYSSVFPIKKVPSIEELIKHKPSHVLIEFLCYASARLEENVEDSSIQSDLLNLLLKRQDAALIAKIKSVLKIDEKRNPAGVFLDIITVLEFINQIITLGTNQLQAQDSTPEDEFALLIGILVINENLSENENNINLIHNSNLGPDELYQQLAWPLLIKSATLRINRHFLIQAYKCIEFLKYISNQPNISSAFIELIGKSEKQYFFEYVVQVLNLYMHFATGQLTNKQVHRFNADLIKQIPFHNHWILDLTKPINDFNSNDFRTLRSRPILKINDNLFLVCKWKFILDKLSTGLIFDLFEKSNLNQSYKSFADFKNEIGENFSEKFIVNMLKTWSRTQLYHFSEGSDNSTLNQDFYIRKHNQICLFEIKDALMVKEFKDELIKKNGEFNLISDELSVKIGGKKGIDQLIKQLDKLCINPSIFEQVQHSLFNLKKVTIQPVIVITDTGFTMTGMEDYLNKIFKTKIKDKNYPFYVHRLILIDEAYLLINHDNILFKKLDLFKEFSRFRSKKTKLKRISKSRFSSIDQKISGRKGFMEIINNYNYFSKRKNDNRSLYNKVKCQLENN